MQTYRHTIAGEVVTVNVPQTPADLDAFYAWAQEADRRGPIALDTETTGLKIFGASYRLRTVQFGDARTAWVIHWERGGEFQQFARAVLQSARKFIIHNGMFDWLVLDRHAGIPIESLAPRTRDTRIMATLIDPRQPQAGGRGTALKPLAAYWVDPAAPDTQDGLTDVFKSLGLTKETGWAGIPLAHPVFNLYGGLDVILAARLEPQLSAELTALGVRPALLDYEHQIARMCSLMTRTGMILDEPYTRSLDNRLADESGRYAEQAARYGVANVNAPRQIAEALAGMGEILRDRTATGAVRVDKKTLLALADMDLQWERLNVRKPNPLAVSVLHSKRAGKWRSSYASALLDAMGDDGRIHPNISPLAARTGRMGVERPALQQLPATDHMIRRALLAEPGHVMISTDFQAVELRVLAALADVKVMKSAILAGEDLHGFTASLIYGPDYTPKHRKLAKAGGLGKVYGGGAETLSAQSGAPIEDVRRMLAAYDRIYPEVKRASNRWQREAYANGMVCISPTGRRLPLDRDRSYAATNYMCQSTARDVLGQALLNIEEAGLLGHCRLPIHDEVLCSAPADEAAEIAREIERCMSFDLFGVPIGAESEIGGRSWGSLYGADY